MSTSTEERIAEIMESQTVWIGEADCNDGTRPIIIESKMVPAIGEFLGIVLPKTGTDAHQALLTAADQAEARPADAPAGLTLPQDLPRNQIAAATGLLGGGSETQASFSRKKDDNVTSPHKALAPRTAEVTFDKSEGTITGTLTGSRCSTFTGTQPD